MFPMTFEEFLIACGEELLRDGIKDAYEKSVAMPAGVHEKALRLYRDYLLVGGMPESILDYLDRDKDVMHLSDSIRGNLRTAYLADMNKYTTSAAEGVKIAEIYRSIPRQLAKENPKFKYNEVRPHANKRDFSMPLDWLVASGMILRVQKLETPQSPLKGYVCESGEKVYLSDVGLLCDMCGVKPRDLAPDVHNIYKGGIVENYVMQEFAAAGKNLFYFKPSESMEIDLVYDDGEKIIPVEIKSGRHKRSTSLKNCMEKYAPQYAIRFSELNFGEVNGIRSIPLYAVWCLK